MKEMTNRPKENDFWKSVRESAKALEGRPSWMFAGITLNSKVFETYEKEKK